MKKFIIAVVVLAVVAIGVLVYAGSQAGTLVNNYKPEIEKAASKAIGSKVSLGSIDLKVFPNVRAVVGDVSIKPKQGDAKGVSLDNLLLGIELFPLLTGHLEISSVSLSSPALTIVKSEQGIYLEGLPPPAKQPKVKQKKEAATKSEGGAATSKAAVSAPLAISVNEIAISNAALTIKDQVQKKEYMVKNVNLSTGVALDGDRVTLQALDLDGSLLGKTPFSVASDKITLSQSEHTLEAPKVTIGVADTSVSVAANLNIKTFAGKISINNSNVAIAGLVPLLSQIAPVVAEYNPTGSIAPSATITLVDQNSFSLDANAQLSDLGANVGELKVSDGNGNASITGSESLQKLSLPDMGLELNGQPIKIALTAEAGKEMAKISSLSVNAFEGTANVDGRFGLSSKELNSKFAVTGLQIEPALKTVAPNSSLFLLGTVENLAGTLSGSLKGDKPLAGLRSATQLKVADGKLVGTNIMGQVLQALVSLPVVSEGLSSKLPPEAKADLQSDDTLIKSLSANFNLVNEVLRTKDLELVSGAFRLTAQGSVGLDTSIDLRSQFRFTPPVSEALAVSVKELRKLINEKGEMVIPLQLSGKGSSLLVLPDLEEITKIIAKGVIREKASELISEGIGKLFGR